MRPFIPNYGFFKVNIIFSFSNNYIYWTICQHLARQTKRCSILHLDLWQSPSRCQTDTRKACWWGCTGELLWHRHSSAAKCLHQGFAATRNTTRSNSLAITALLGMSSTGDWLLHWNEAAQEQDSVSFQRQQPEQTRGEAR